MRTEKQIEASRRNGAKSKGPITEEGKAISSLNGTKHGLSGGHRFLYSNERDDPYQELFTHYMSLFAPANGVEEDLVHQIVAASWRMKRIDRIEAATVDVQMDRQQKWVDKEYKGIEDDTRQAIAFQTHTVGDTVALVGRYHARALRSFNSAYKFSANCSASDESNKRSYKPNPRRWKTKRDDRTTCPQRKSLNLHPARASTARIP